MEETNFQSRDSYLQNISRMSSSYDVIYSDLLSTVNRHLERSLKSIIVDAMANSTLILDISLASHVIDWYSKTFEYENSLISIVKEYYSKTPNNEYNLISIMNEYCSLTFKKRFGDELVSIVSIEQAAEDIIRDLISCRISSLIDKETNIQDFLGKSLSDNLSNKDLICIFDCLDDLINDLKYNLSHLVDKSQDNVKYFKKMQSVYDLIHNNQRNLVNGIGTSDLSNYGKYFV